MDINKLIAKLPTGFVDEVSSMGDEQIEAAVITSNENIREVNRAEKEDENLQGLKEALKDAKAPYADTRKAQNAKIAYLLHVREERGKDTHDIEMEVSKPSKKKSK